MLDISERKWNKIISRISLTQSITDLILICYFFTTSQWAIVALCSTVIILNAWYCSFDYLSQNLRYLRDFKVDLFHCTAQMFYLSLSIAYYHTDSAFIDIMFVSIFLCFVYHFYHETGKMTLDLDNNRKMTIIFCLCVMLDYLHAIILILNKLYLTNNWYFYRFILSSFPFSIGICVAIVYDDVHRYGCLAYLKRIDGKLLWEAFWCSVAFFVCLPVLMEGGNASWIIFLYEQFFAKLRHARSLEEEVKDEMVKWLHMDQAQLLRKVCMINHLNLLRQKVANSNPEFLQYLESNVECNKSYYAKVTWSEFKCTSRQFVNQDLMQSVLDDITRFYDLDGWRRELQRSFDAFTRNPTLLNLHTLLSPAVFGCLLLFLAWYALLKWLNIFVWPFATLWITWDTMKRHEMSFTLMFFVLLAVILYKLYQLVWYEVILWYVMPNIESQNCSKQDIERYMEYCTYITDDIASMRQILQHVFGRDVANVVLLYTPDFITLYKESME